MTIAPLREIGGPVGPLEALLDEPRGGSTDVVRAACVIAHAHPLHGGTMHMKVVYQASKALAQIGVPCLRFNFRGVGSSRGVHDGGPGEMADYRAALDFLADRYRGAALWAAGYSFGSWVAWNTALDDTRVPVVIGIGLPVTQFDFSPVRTSEKAKFLIHGELDDLIAVRDIRKFYAELREPKELVVIDGADHLFDGKTSEVGEAIADLLKGWEP
jgi:alpha/beta superfamily hydrolase